MHTQETLRGQVAHVRPTSRLKTIQTIVDKLKRERSMSLSRMRDIAGIRIVEEIDRQQQDLLVLDVCDALSPLGRVKVIDRRRRPSHGYRAVHVEFERDSRYVEIQIRTRRQDQWAQIVERLGDRWGRQIRYGYLPAEPERSAAGLARGELWDLLLRLADVIDNHETLIVDPEDDLTLATESRQIDSVLDAIQRAAESGRL